MPSPAVRAAGRRSVAEHKVRIAVWDTHSQFPDLHFTLDRLNAAQAIFGFEIVDLSVPMDAWHIQGETRYLDADRFAERLAPQISQLGVHYISAIVDDLMVCDVATKPDYGIYGWWPGPDKPPVLIFSTKKLGLKPTGAATDRALANVAVGGIAGYLKDADSHTKGPATCPRYYNPNRELEVLTSRQKFCSVCADKLGKSHPEELKALNAILAAFD
jgi:hypothetical protein